MKQVACADVTCYFLSKKKYSFFELKDENLAEEYTIVASISNSRNVSVSVDYTDYKVEAASYYWTKIDVKQFLGFYLEKSNM